MPTPKLGYFLRDGTRVPGTTTIIGRWKDSGALMQWAFRQGKEGKSRLYEETEKAADIGTCVHTMVEMEMSGGGQQQIIDYTNTTLPNPDMRQKAWSGFNAYQAWSKNYNVRVIAQEIQLVSEKYKFGGTPDFVGVANNTLALFDIKTSGGIYTDYLVQVAAYGELWNENNPDNPITGGYHILRFSKENGDFGHHHYADLSEAWRQFVLFREAYDIDKILRKRAA